MREIKIQTKNLKLGGIAFGKPSNSPVIALHGWLDNAASFIPIAPYLNDIYLIAIDFPGHGKSEHRHGVNAYHFIDYAADVLLAAEALGFKKFNLLGHSLGGAISALITSAAPEKVIRLAMIEGLAPLTGTFENTNKQLRRHLEQTLKGFDQARVYKNVERAALARQAAGDLLLSSARLIAARNLRQLEDGSYVWRTDRLLRRASPLYLAENHVIHYLSEITSEALLIRSADGIIQNWDAMQGREKYIKNLKIVDIEGGHHCHMDDPPQTAKHLNAFFHHGR